MKKKTQPLHYHYLSYGLKIRSDIEFPELMPAMIQEVDLQIVLGTPPHLIYGSVNTGNGWQYTINDQEMLYQDINLGKYYVEKAERIVISPISGLKDINAFRLVILTTMMTVALLQRKRLSLHACAVRKNGLLTLLSGHSGAGKSTTLAGLIQRNYTIFSDDVVVINSDLSAHASYPMMKLWEDTQEKFSDPIFNDKSFVIKSGFKKYGIFFHDHFITDSCQIKQVITLKKCDVEQIEIQELHGFSALKSLAESIYRPQLLDSVESKSLAFRIISHLTEQCKVYQIRRPENCDPYKLLNHVENLL